jgi:hypothetical protein
LGFRSLSALAMEDPTEVGSVANQPGVSFSKSLLNFARGEAGLDGRMGGQSPAHLARIFQNPPFPVDDRPSIETSS